LPANLQSAAAQQQQQYFEKKISFNQKLIIQFLMESFNTTTKRTSDFVVIINIFIIWRLPLLPMSANLQWQQQQQKNNKFSSNSSSSNSSSSSIYKLQQNIIIK
jgi:hypothetical protein